MEQLINDITAIAANILNLKTSEIKYQDHFVKDLGADSLAILNIIALLEQQYQIQLPTVGIQDFMSVEKLVELTKKELS